MGAVVAYSLLRIETVLTAGISNVKPTTENLFGGD